MKQTVDVQLTNECGKNYCNRTTLVQVIAEDEVACVLSHRVDTAARGHGAKKRLLQCLLVL